jgi:hydroxymethylpyrimidine pyrophosphatase-like HAD family hydrolase
MLAHSPATELTPHSPGQSDISAGPLPPRSERDFYEGYGWCLNPYPTVREAIDRLRGEIGRLDTVPDGWQAGEVATNIYLLACALLNGADEYLRGTTLRLPGGLAKTRLGRAARSVTEVATSIPRHRRRGLVRRWQERWRSSVDDFLPVLVARQAADSATVARAASGLAKVLRNPLPPELEAEHLGVPSPFRRHDLTHFDVLALGQQYAARFPHRSEPLLLVGLRTSGSYFAPLLAAYFNAQGYQSVAWLTVQVQKGPGRRERQELRRFARHGCTAVIVDDPPHSAGTVMRALDMARRAGFGRDLIRVLVPTHPVRRSWFKSVPAESLPAGLIVTLEPEQWHVNRLLDPKAVEQHVSEYFPDHAGVRVVPSEAADRFNACLRTASQGGRGTHAKRVYELQLETHSGHKETRYIIAKSVGWGWLGYQAFLAGCRLSGYVPPILGMREGILYSAWIPSDPPDNGKPESRLALIETSASYLAARVRGLRLETTPLSGTGLRRDCRGIRLQAEVLSKAYGRLGTDLLARGSLEQRLTRQCCPYPTLIDGKMQRAEWLAGSRGLLKTDYEHHGLGKAELNVIDPAYDLADVIQDLELTPEEESGLIRRYITESGDARVGQRLMVNKLLAGAWAMDAAQDSLFGKGKTMAGQQTCHERTMRAWNFLTVHAARYCGSHWHPPAGAGWRAPLVVLDVDGVLDRRLFGFPCITAAGMEALSLLSAHNVSVALNTARSVTEVKDYCDAYSLAGGVAEHGSYLWDAVGQRGQVLISAEAMRQLDELRRHLRTLPGVFLDDRHRFSIRAFTYKYKGRAQDGFLSLLDSIRSAGIGTGAPVPLQRFVMDHFITELGLDCLRFHNTRIDTTVVAKAVDKGVGLSALRDWVLGPDAATVAVGDSEFDLPMFRVATRSFAPAQIDCARQARLLGCRIARHPYQRGLLEIARMLLHPDGRECDRCKEALAACRDKGDLFLELLRAADRGPVKSLVRAPFGLAAFFRMALH